MNLIYKPPPDSTAQILEYAESGRLVPALPEGRSHPLVALTVAGGVALGAGAVLLLTGALGVHQPISLLAAGLLLITGLAILAPAVRLLRRSMSPVIPVRPGAVLPPDRIREGFWIHRQGGWVRVEQIGRSGGGKISALISTGDVIELRRAVTVAGDEFRPVQNPLVSLRT